MDALTTNIDGPAASPDLAARAAAREVGAATHEAATSERIIAEADKMASYEEAKAKSDQADSEFWSMLRRHMAAGTIDYDAIANAYTAGVLAAYDAGAQLGLAVRS